MKKVFECVEFIVNFSFFLMLRQAVLYLKKEKKYVSSERMKGNVFISLFCISVKNVNV